MAIATVPIISQVAVTGSGTVPRATELTDLGRPSPPPPLYLPGPGFAYPSPGGQRLALAVDRVVAGSTSTSVQWRVRSLTDGPGLQQASTPPFGASEGGPTGNRMSASAPLLGTEDAPSTIHPLLTTDSTGPGQTTECLCSDLRAWPSALRRADRLATLVTTYPALPPEQTEIIVTFPGQGERRARVHRQPAASTRTAGTIPIKITVSIQPRDAAAGWDVNEWPTPVPAPALVNDIEPNIDRLVR